MPIIKHIASDGTETDHDVSDTGLDNLKALVNYEAFDFINLRDGRYMAVDDNGHIRSNIPPVNEKATKLYHSICIPGTTWPIVGDVLIFNENE